MCFVVPTLHPAGAERVTLTLIEAMTHDHQVTVITFADSHPSGVRQVNWSSAVPAGCAYVHLRAKPGAVNHVWRLVRLFFVLRRARPNAVVSVMTYANLLAALVARVRRFTHIATEHNTAAPGASGPDVVERLARWSYGARTTLVAVSHAVLSDLVRRGAIGGEQSSAVIYNPVNPDVVRAGVGVGRSPTVASDFLVVVGRLNHQKGHDLVLEALARVPAADRPRFRFVGDGPERGALERMANDLGVQSDVDFVGWESNPFQAMADSRGVVSMSRWEGFGMVVAESAALGCAFLGPEIPVIREVASLVGYQRLTQATPDVVADALVDLWTNPQTHRPKLPFPDALRPRTVAEAYVALAQGRCRSQRAAELTDSNA